jgi:CDP-glucose 4,6-dehydratase
MKDDIALNNWLNKNVFVTGCTGLLGSWLVEELIKLGANVVALVLWFINSVTY